LPARSLTPVVIVAEYWLLVASATDGIKTAVTPVYVTVPDKAVVPCRKVKVALLTVKGSITSLKTAIIALLMVVTLVLPGLVELTVGAIVSGVAPVVKLHV
jgi:hypothetical protein